MPLLRLQKLQALQKILNAVKPGHNRVRIVTENITRDQDFLFHENAPLF